MSPNPRIQGGIQRHPITGQEYIQLSDAQMSEIADLINGGLGRKGLPQNAGSLLSKYTRNPNAERQEELYRHKLAVLKDLAHGRGSKRNVRKILDAQKWYSDICASHEKGVITAGNLHHDQLLTNLSVAYANQSHIWPMLCAVVPVPKQTDKIPDWSKRNALQAPDDALGKGGDANEVEWDIGNRLFTTEGRGHKAKSYGEDVANADAPYDVLATDQETVLQTLDLRREQRTRDLVTTASNYASTNTTPIAAANRWDSAGGGYPIKNMQDARAAVWEGIGPTELVMGSSLAVYHVLSRHPQMLGLFQYNGSSPGLATPDMIAQFLRADRYVIGEAREATGNEAKTATYQRIWPDKWFLLRVPVGQATRKNAFFCAFLRWTMAGAPNVQFSQDGIITTQWFDGRKGTAGVFYVKVATNEVEIVICNDCGYLYETPIG